MTYFLNIYTEVKTSKNLNNTELFIKIDDFFYFNEISRTPTFTLLSTVTCIKNVRVINYNENDINNNNIN